MAKVIHSKQPSNAQRAAPKDSSHGKRRVGPAATKVELPRASGKIAKIVTLLRRPKGATITDLIKATEWQAHSVRGVISGTIKKKLGLKVVSEKSGDVRTYRIAN